MTLHAEETAPLPAAGPSPAATREQCGSYYGYNIHFANGEKSCTPCLEALRKHRKEYRSDRAVAAVDAWYTRTRAKALRQLAKEYPARFLEILDEVREANPKPQPADAEAA